MAEKSKSQKINSKKIYIYIISTKIEFMIHIPIK